MDRIRGGGYQGKLSVYVVTSELGGPDHCRSITAPLKEGSVADGPAVPIGRRPAAAAFSRSDFHP